MQKSIDELLIAKCISNVFVVIDKSFIAKYIWNENFVDKVISDVLACTSDKLIVAKKSY